MRATKRLMDEFPALLSPRDCKGATPVSRAFGAWLREIDARRNTHYAMPLARTGMSGLHAS